MFNYYRNYPYQFSHLPVSRNEGSKPPAPNIPKPPPPCKPPPKKKCPPKKKFDFKTLKKDTCTSLNDVECFLDNFSHTLKYIRLINLLK